MRRIAFVSPGMLLRMMRHYMPMLPLLVEIAALALLMPVLKRCLSLRGLIRFVQRWQLPVPGPRLEPTHLVRLTRGLLHIDNGPIHPNCMTESLILLRILWRWGYPVAIHFGVLRREFGLQGHCWLDVAGQPVNERSDVVSIYRIIYSSPGNCRSAMARRTVHG